MFALSVYTILYILCEQTVKTWHGLCTCKDFYFDVCACVCVCSHLMFIYILIALSVVEIQNLREIDLENKQNHFI